MLGKMTLLPFRDDAGHSLLLLDSFYDERDRLPLVFVRQALTTAPVELAKGKAKHRFSNRRRCNVQLSGREGKSLPLPFSILLPTAQAGSPECSAQPWYRCRPGYLAARPPLRERAWQGPRRGWHQRQRPGAGLARTRRG